MVVAAVALCSACGPLPPPAPPRQTSLGLELSNLALANGLRVVLVRDPRAVEVQVTMRYQVGDVDDPPGQAGIAHLVEHLMYQQVLGDKSLFARLEDITTWFNGQTSLDATVYMERAQPAHLDEMLSVEAVRLGFRCTSITDATFVREREVVLNELRQRDDTTRIFDVLHQAMYPVGHPYHRPAGDDASVAAITRDQACAFADAHYAPRNAVLVVSGDLSTERLRSALGKFLGHIAARAAVAPTAVPSVEPASHRIEARAPIDDGLLVIAWPLPADPRLRVQVRAVLQAASDGVDDGVRGRVAAIELGDERAPMLGLVVVPALGETLAQVVERTEKAIEAMPASFLVRGLAGEVRFDRVQQAGIYDLYARLEADGQRDVRLAGYVLAGLDPSAVLGAQFRGLNELTAGEAARIASSQLGLDRATVVLLSPDGKRRGHAPALGAPIHDLQQRRDPPDPAGAHRPAGERAVPAFAGLVTRRLANGLSVVLLPLTTVPTVDVRLVFRAGTADEPAEKRGAALVAAHALTWNQSYLNDMLRFVAAGGGSSVDVAADHTSFSARGLDMHLDLLLAGLRRWIRDGRYGTGAGSIVNALRREAKHTDDDGAVTDAWRLARFGTGHPYVEAGLVRHASAGLVAADAAAFRAAHFTPDNATLVIAGRFDAALAERWIDFLFAEWTGLAEARQVTRTSPTPASIARDAATAQIGVQIAMPAVQGTRASQLIAAEMLGEIAGDVRHQLGASYGIGARLDEGRLASGYALAGWVEAGRAAEVVVLLRDRIAALRTDPDTAARAFVSARERVLTQLLAATGSAATIADRVERDLELGREPLSDLATATAVRTLQIEGMAPALADLDLARAAILLTGPASEVDAAFGAIDRVATRVHGTRDGKSTAARDTADEHDDAQPLVDLEDALTAQGPRLHYRFGSGYALGKVRDQGITGIAIGGALGYRLEGGATLGVSASLAHLSGTHDGGTFVAGQVPIEATPIGLGAFVEAMAYERLWGLFDVGLQLDRVVDSTMPVDWRFGVRFGIEGGVEVVGLGKSQLGLFARIDSELFSSGGYAALSFGVALRR